MKKTCLILLVLLAALQFSFAQWTTSGATIYNSNTGNVGIGTTTPNNKLTVHLPASNTGNVITWGNVGGGFFGGLGFDANGSYLSLFSGSSGLYQNGANGNVGIRTASPAAYLHITGAEYTPGTSGSTQNSNLRIGASTINLVLDAGVGTAGNPTPYSWLQNRNQATYAANYDLALNPNGGNVGIGTIDTKGYKLAVSGSAVATSMKVKLYANWPDFVFLKDYKLPTLTEVKDYIDKNQHLPEIPIADEVYTNGLDLGEMNRLLLKKVEELTLYLIQKDEQLKDEQKINRLQQEQINQLKKQMDIMRKSILNR